MSCRPCVVKQKHKKKIKRKVSESLDRYGGKE
jgi:hypothetical protein